jgi:hypothetical protein
MHNLQRIVDSRSSGAYSDLHAVQLKLHGYRKWRSEKISAKRYEDVAYIEGYLAGMTLALTYKDDAKLAPPLVFVYARDPFWVNKIEDYKRELARVRRRSEHHKGALIRANSLANKLSKLGHDQLVYHHKCQLL